MSDLLKTFGGANAEYTKQWHAYGVETCYDDAKEDLEFKLPEGWVDGMNETDRTRRASEWCIDEATYGVEYYLEYKVFDETQEKKTCKMHFAELDSGELEIYTGTDLSPIFGVSEGARVTLELYARVKMAKGNAVTLKLLAGEFRGQEKLAVLGKNSPGLFFVAEAGFSVFIHYGGRDCVTHIAFVGVVDDLVK